MTDEELKECREALEKTGYETEPLGYWAQYWAGWLMDKAEEYYHSDRFAQDRVKYLEERLQIAKVQAEHLVDLL